MWVRVRRAREGWGTGVEGEWGIREEEEEEEEEEEGEGGRSFERRSWRMKDLHGGPFLSKFGFGLQY